MTLMWIAIAACYLFLVVCNGRLLIMIHAAERRLNRLEAAAEKRRRDERR